MKINLAASDLTLSITDGKDEPLFSLAADHYTVSIDLDKLVTEVGSLAELVQRVESELYKAAS